MDYLPLIISLVTGAIGGNLTGALAKNLSLGTLGNSLAGILGGGLGSQILSLLGIAAAPGGNLDIGSIVGSIASGGVGGGALMAIIGIVKQVLASKK